jgi:hypothetical protein
MAGRGPAPKLPGQRRRYGQPARSEWVDLKPLEQPVLGPPHGKWSPNAKRAWRAWSQDPVTSQWGSSDVFLAKELARLYDVLAPNEQRLRMDTLGLSPKGKRDLRWRTPAEVKTIAAQQPSEVRRPRVVARPDSEPAGEPG